MKQTNGSKKTGKHIKIQTLCNEDMQLLFGGKEWTCGSSSSNDCGKITVVLEKSDLLSLAI